MPTDHRGDNGRESTMASEGEVWVQLATRIPKNLHRELKLHCVKSDVSVMEFVVKALEEKLSREAGGKGKRAARA
jgi:predicted HicB family RNase H-like nuclease